jgi:hypothetical protein
MPRRGIAVRRVRMRQIAGDVGMPTRPGGRRRVAGIAAVNRTAGIGSGSASGGRRKKKLLKKLLRNPRRRSARVSAQPILRKKFLAPVRAVMSCLFLRSVVLISNSVRACAARLYGVSSSARRGGDGGVKAVRGIAAGFHPGARKYVVAHCRSLACGPIVVPPLRRIAAALFQNE